MKMNVAARGRARRFAAQALYQWQMSQSEPSDIEAQFYLDNDFSKVDKPYFRELLQNVVAKQPELDAHFKPFLQGLSFDKLDPVTLALLRLSSYELAHRVDVPYKVVINESVNLAKKFAAADAHKFINGVLDKTAASLRQAEVSAQASRTR